MYHYNIAKGLTLTIICWLLLALSLLLHRSILIQVPLAFCTSMVSMTFVLELISRLRKQKG